MGEADEAGLRRPVLGRLVRRAADPARRGHVDHRAPAAPAHRREHQLRGEHRRAQVQVQRGAPLQRRGVNGVRRRSPPAGVVDQDVDPAVALLGEGDHVLDVAVDAHVGADVARGSATLGDRRHRRLARDVRDVGDHDRHALVGQPHHDRPAGARSRRRSRSRPGRGSSIESASGRSGPREHELLGQRARGGGDGSASDRDGLGDGARDATSGAAGVERRPRRVVGARCPPCRVDARSIR